MVHTEVWTRTRSRISHADKPRLVNEIFILWQEKSNAKEKSKTILFFNKTLSPCAINCEPVKIAADCETDAPPPLLISNLTTLMNGFASVEFLGIHGHITWYKYLLILQTEATSHVGGRFHQLFGSNLVEPAEEDLLNELSGHLHYGFQTQSTSENRVNFRL